MKKPFFVKIFVGYFLITCLFSSVIFFLSLRVIRQHQINTFIENLEQTCYTFQPAIIGLLQQSDLEGLSRVVEQTGSAAGLRFTIINLDGDVLADSEKPVSGLDNHRDRPEIAEAILGRPGASLRHSDSVKETMLYVAVPVKDSAGNTFAVVRASVFITDIEIILKELTLHFLYIILTSLVVLLTITYFFSKRLTRPLNALSRASKKIAGGDFNVRVESKPEDEFSEFSDSFNSMTEKIRSLFQEVSVQKEELNNIIASIHEALIVVDDEGKIILANESLKQLTDETDVEGKFYWEIIRAPQFGEIIKQIQQGSVNSINEIVIHDKTFLCSSSLIQPRKEIVITLLDVSEIRNVERIKKDFVINVSHELRTPLTAIKGFIETITEELEDTTHKHYLDIISRHTDRLINIVKDLLVLSNIEKDPQLEIGEVNLKTMIDNVYKIYEQKLAEKNLSFNTSLSKDPCIIQADAFKMEQVFLNLIDNAIKYTEAGGISVDVDQDAAGTRIAVRDTGIGIPANQTSRIFERFYVVDKSRSRRVGGTGLGLSIVKHIILLHKGAIEVNSAKGSGTAFIINLPAHTPES